MTKKRIGVDAAGANANELVAHIQELEALGIEAAWLTTGGAGLDALSVFAAAGAQTQRIFMGTGITPTWPRHPIAAIQQVQVIAQLAPGRFRFGVGPSGKEGMVDMFGADFRAPVTNVKEYVQVCKSLLQEGSVDFQGTQYTARAEIEPIPDVPIMASALGSGAFKACGQVTDGAISWLCPAAYLSEVAVPALEEGAREAARPTPPSSPTSAPPSTRTSRRFGTWCGTSSATFPRLSTTPECSPPPVSPRPWTRAGGAMACWTP